MKLCWPVRQSFVAYIERAGGSIEVSGEATRDGAMFTFPGSAPTRERWEFRGIASFVAHGGMLAVHLIDPEIAFDSEVGVLSVATEQRGGGRRLPIARILDRHSADGVTRADVRLTLHGSRLFGDVYNPGDLMEPVEVHHADA